MRALHEIIVHCTATDANWRQDKPTSDKVAAVRSWHVDGNGWSDIGYHYLIDRDGTVAEGRPLSRNGAHTKGRNTGTVGIALFGGRTSTASDLFKENFTPEQERSLLLLIAELKAKYPTITAVNGHNQFAAKACPGFNAPAWYENATKAVPAPAQPVLAPAPHHEAPQSQTAAPVASVEAPEPDEGRKSIWQSTTVRSVLAVVGTNAGVVGTTWGGLDDTTKIIVGCLAGIGLIGGMIIFSERLKKWIAGDR